MGESSALCLLLLVVASCAWGLDEAPAAAAPTGLPPTSGPPEDAASTVASLLSSTNAPTTNASAFRLPEHLRPEHYVLDIKTYLVEDDFRFEGRVQVRVFVVDDTPRVVLHSRGLNVTTDDVRVTHVGSGRVLEVDGHEFDLDNNFYTIHLKEQLKKDEKYLVDVPYKAPLSSLLAGYYRSSYKDKKTGQIRCVYRVQSLQKLCLFLKSKKLN